MYKYLDELLAKVKIGKDVFIAINATIIGDVTLHDQVSVWYNAVIRSDMDSTVIGAGTCIQDGVILHTDPGKPIRIGTENIIGHAAIVHGCTIGNNNLIGIRSTILNDAVIGNCCIIGAHTLVTEGMEIPDYSLVLGSPAKVIKQVPENIIEKLKWGASVYIQEAQKYLDSYSESES